MRMIQNFEAEEGVSCAVFRRYNKLIAPHVTNLHAIKRRVCLEISMGWVQPSHSVIKMNSQQKEVTNCVFSVKTLNVIVQNVSVMWPSSGMSSQKCTKKSKIISIQAVPYICHYAMWNCLNKALLMLHFNAESPRKFKISCFHNLRFVIRAFLYVKMIRVGQVSVVLAVSSNRVSLRSLL